MSSKEWQSWIASRYIFFFMYELARMNSALRWDGLVSILAEQMLIRLSMLIL